MRGPCGVCGDFELELGQCQRCGLWIGISCYSMGNRCCVACHQDDKVGIVRVFDEDRNIRNGLQG